MTRIIMTIASFAVNMFLILLQKKPPDLLGGFFFLFDLLAWSTYF